jgi:uncharacterized membrane protein YkgB
MTMFPTTTTSIKTTVIIIVIIIIVIVITYNPFQKLREKHVQPIMKHHPFLSLISKQNVLIRIVTPLSNMNLCTKILTQTAKYDL